MISEIINNLIFNINNVSIWYIIFLTIISIGVCNDKRFTGKRKIIFIIIIITINVVFLMLNKMPYKILTDIFWYTSIMYSTMIYHVLICEWMYKILYKYRQEYMYYVTQSISEMVSLTQVLCLIVMTRKKIYEYLKKKEYKERTIEKYLFVSTLVEQVVKYQMLKWNQIATYIVCGNEEWKGMPWKRKVEIVIKNFIIFVTVLFIAVYIVKMARLYVMWGILIIWEMISYIRYTRKEKKEVINYRSYLRYRGSIGPDEKKINKYYKKWHSNEKLDLYIWRTGLIIYYYNYEEEIKLAYSTTIRESRMDYVLSIFIKYEDWFTIAKKNLDNEYESRELKDIETWYSALEIAKDYCDSFSWEYRRIKELIKPELWEEMKKEENKELRVEIIEKMIEFKELKEILR